jgi:hypothetical protein
MHVTGIFSSWIYLRFYKKADSLHRGDRSETFSFASFFPDSLQYFEVIKASHQTTLYIGVYQFGAV